ncbi:isochorismatase family protein [Myceligenerans xiligouense]|uniref:Isochorismate hydrolase n=1 Tax=Myceligenerans xiligouense TaxID=253184 RepID=A0A3N4Z782_9MICO|nr:isochorismatase family protein [Myceligenerans xiligouense]RPF21688.1 isochorismate hydrolase [Myceligenerans xiligouense]
MAGIPQIAEYTLPEAADLPANTARWTARPDRAVLLIHDMQRYFLDPFPESLRLPLIRNVALLRDRAAAQGVPIAYTAQPGSMTAQQRGLLKEFWGPGMRRSPSERAIVDDLAPAQGAWMLTKWRYSAFLGTDLLERIRATGRDQLVVCGVYAHVGILATAVESFSHDIETIVVGDATADFSPEEHRQALAYAAARCATVLPAREVLP